MIKSFLTRKGSNRKRFNFPISTVLTAATSPPASTFSPQAVRTASWTTPHPLPRTARQRADAEQPRNQTPPRPTRRKASTA